VHASPCLKPYNQHKVQFHISKCVFLGHNNLRKGYKCLNSTRRVFISRHVVFNEQHFPFHEGFLNKKGLVQTITDFLGFIYPISTTGFEANGDHSNERKKTVETEKTTATPASNPSRSSSRNSDVAVSKNNSNSSEHAISHSDRDTSNTTEPIIAT